MVDNLFKGDDGLHFLRVASLVENEMYQVMGVCNPFYTVNTETVQKMFCLDQNIFKHLKVIDQESVRQMLATLRVKITKNSHGMREFLLGKITI